MLLLFADVLDPALVAGYCHRVGWRLCGPSGTPGQPSIRVTPARAPSPVTLYARCVRDATVKVHPSNERCPCRSPGGRTATFSDWPRCFDPGGFGLPLSLTRRAPLPISQPPPPS